MWWSSNGESVPWTWCSDVQFSYLPRMISLHQHKTSASTLKKFCSRCYAYNDDLTIEHFLSRDARGSSGLLAGICSGHQDDRAPRWPESNYCIKAQVRLPLPGRRTHNSIQTIFPSLSLSTTKTPPPDGRKFTPTSDWPTGTLFKLRLNASSRQPVTRHPPQKVLRLLIESLTRHPTRRSRPDTEKTADLDCHPNSDDSSLTVTDLDNKTTMTRPFPT